MNCFQWIADLIEVDTDPRTRDWFMMRSVKPTVWIVAGYVLFVKVIGPMIMKNREPFKLRKIIIYYNFIEVCLSCYLFYEAAVVCWIFGNYSWRCQPVDYSTSPLTMRIIAGSHLYFMSKYTEFLDTIFFVLRKKNNQITVLHVVHHGAMPLITYLGLRFVAGGHATFFGFLNTFVHIIMYSYYFLAAFGPKYQKYLWWKKYITRLQLAQFVAIFFHSGQLFFIDCKYPRVLALFEVFMASFFIVMFSNFYIQAYKDAKKATIEADHKSNAKIKSS